MKSTEATLGEFVDEARRRAFTGREAELAELLAAVESLDERPRLHFVHGPGGIGKTALLAELGDRCEEIGARVVRVDARDLGVDEERLGDALARATEDRGTGRREPRVVLIDNFTPLAPLESWLRRDLLPGLPARLHLVIATRERPGTVWRTELGWANLVDIVALRGFERAETEAYLAARGVDAEHHAALHRVTGGHPLALALSVESGATGSSAGLAQDVVAGLLDRFREEVPSPLHDAALQAACIVRTTQERLLRSLLEVDDAGALFDWLAGLSFVESARDGLRPHDLVRETVGAQARARDPVGTRRLHARARSWYLRQLIELKDQPHGPGATQAMLGLAFLHRANPIGRGFLEWADETLRTVPATGKGLAAAAAIVERHQGPEALRWHRYWAERQPDQVFVCTGSGRGPAGMLQYVLLSDADRADAGADPCTRAAFEWVDRTAPLRANEKILLTRYWMDAACHQRVSPVQVCLWVHTTIRYRMLRGLAFGIAVFHDPDFWSKPFRYMDFARAEGADFEVGGHTYGMFAHDWRQLPVSRWNRLLAERQLDPEAAPSPRSQHVVVLAREEFENAVLEALRSYARPAELGKSILLASPLILNRVDAEADLTARTRALRELLREAAESLKGHVRGEKRYQALAATYLEPLGTQEVVAERLDLAFSTYRRHLVAAVREITEWLWACETGDEVVRPGAT